MADSNPTDGDRAVAVRLPTHHASFLRGALEMCKEGVEADLASAGDHPHRARAEREAAAYGRLLKALDTCVIAPDDDDVVAVVAKLAEQTDASNEYEQVALEHRALCGLLALLEEGSGR